MKVCMSRYVQIWWKSKFFFPSTFIPSFDPFFIWNKDIKNNNINCWRHSHKKRKDSLETRAILTEISMLRWNLPSGPKHRGSLQNTWLSLKGISCLQVILMLIWMKQTLIWFNLQRDGSGNGLSNTKKLLQKVCSYKCQFCIKVCASSRLVSQVHMMPGQNIKKKYLICQISMKMLK